MVELANTVSFSNNINSGEIQDLCNHVAYNTSKSSYIHSLK